MVALFYSRRPSRARLVTLCSADEECLQFSTETVQRQITVADGDRSPFQSFQDVQFPISCSVRIKDQRVTKILN